MVLALVNAEEVLETEQPQESTIVDEINIVEETTNDFKVSNNLKVVLEDVLDLTTGGMEMHGFVRHDLEHPNKDCEISYFIKGDNVIVADYHGTNTVKIEVLEKKKAEMIINKVNGKA